VVAIRAAPEASASGLCAGREGAFKAYKERDVEVAGFTTCGGCPGGNIESAPEEMKNNGAEVVHLATGSLVGYPPCPYLEHFMELIPEKFGLNVGAGTHPIPQKYFIMHHDLGSWDKEQWAEILRLCLSDEAARIAYN
jgi:predicted metal-binding protein